MKTLKLALLVTTAAGAVTAGGVTYATVGNSTPSAPGAVKSAKGAVAQHVPSVPAAPAVPTCLPDIPKGKALQKIKELAKKAPNAPVTLPATPGGLPQAPAKIPNVTGKIPNVTGKIPNVAGKAKGATGKAEGPTGKVMAAKDAAKLPLCKAGAEHGQQADPPNVPAKPNLPVPNALSCDSVPPVIRSEEGRAKDFTLPNGMHLGAGHAHTIAIESGQACAYTQELVGGAGQMVTVERIKTPPQVTLQELAQSLKVPGSLVWVNGVDTWQSPLNGGMMWYSKNGYAIRIVSNNPTAAALVPGIATQLRTQ